MVDIEYVDCIVVGAGVVGLACARELALTGREVIVLEAEDAIGTQTSSRNSEVIHSGIYYPNGSIKAKTCVRGRKLLYTYCDERKIGYKKLGKLIVASSLVESKEIQRLYNLGKSNGVHDLQIIDCDKVKSLEPDITCLNALLSPSTGIIDSHSFMLSLQGDLENAGGVIAFKSKVLSGKVTCNGVSLVVGEEDTSEISCNLLVNSAGLNAQSLANCLIGFPKKYIPKQYLARGVYFSLHGKSPFSHLIYPAPEIGGLGVHATLDMGGACRFGPDVEWIDECNYDIDPKRSESFYNKIRKYWPYLQDGQLQPAYAGIRPKLSGPNEPASDFIIQGSQLHGVESVINLFGIESPGLTASLAIAEHVLRLAKNS